MRGKLLAKIAKNGSMRPARGEQDRAENGEGSRWEIIFFALFFVTIVFLLGTVARAAGTVARAAGTVASAAPHAAHQPKVVVKAPLAKSPPAGKVQLASLSTTHQQVAVPRGGSLYPSNTSQATSKAMGSYSTSLSNRMNSRTTFAKPAIAARNSNFAFTGALTIETTRNLDQAADTDYTGSYMFVPTVVYVPAKISFGLTALYGAEYSYYRPNGRAGDFEDVKYGLRKTFKNKDDFNSDWIDDFFVGVGGFLPTSNSAAERTFRGSYGPRLGVSKKIDRLTMAYIFGYSRSLFDREKTATGGALYPDTWIHVGMLTYAFTDSFSVGAVAEYAYMVDFENYTTGAQRAIVSADYKLTPNVGFSLGLATVRSTVDLVQQTETFKFYEKESTLAFFDLVLSI
jgi:hypothetical protein